MVVCNVAYCALVLHLFGDHSSTQLEMLVCSVHIQASGMRRVQPSDSIVSVSHGCVLSILNAAGPVALFHGKEGYCSRQDNV